MYSPPMHPCLTPPLKWNPSEFLAETYPAKTIGPLCGENCMILTSTVLNWFTMWHTDWRQHIVRSA